MARILAEFVLPIALPTALYVLWLAAQRRRAERAGKGEPARWQDAPWLWLVALGLLFSAVLTVGLALFGREEIKGTYVPPKLVDGEIVPGHVIPPGAPSR
ncbi:MAG: DUF6111 family protein [Pseudomonadota bacterium]